MAAKTFDEFWEHKSGWYDPNEPQGLSEYVLAQAAWNAAIAAEALKPSHNISRDAIALLREIRDICEKDIPDSNIVDTIYRKVDAAIAQQHPC